MNHWEKTVKKLVALHLIVAFLLVVITLREKETVDNNRNLLMGAIVLLSIATFVTTVCFLRCLLMAVTGEPYVEAPGY